MANKIKLTNRFIRSLFLPLIASAVITGCATPAGEVDVWPITNAEKSGLTGQVVDVLCELNGNCADNCGEGTRQLGIKTEAGGTVLVAKNLSNYSGAAEELWNYCGEVVEVNGLFTEHQGVRFFQAQNVRAPDGQWQKATRFLDVWTERTGKPASLAKNWQYHDEVVNEIIERDGRLGLGPEADQDYFESQ